MKFSDHGAELWTAWKFFIFLSFRGDNLPERLRYGVKIWDVTFDSASLYRNCEVWLKTCKNGLNLCRIHFYSAPRRLHMVASAIFVRKIVILAVICAKFKMNAMLMRQVNHRPPQDKKAGLVIRMDCQWKHLQQIKSFQEAKKSKASAWDVY